MSNTLIIHVGTGKTGTSAIQKFLADNAEELKKYGWMYPNLVKDWDGRKVPYEGEFPKNGLIVKRMFVDEWDDADKEKVWALINGYLKESNVILSEEGIWSHPQIDIKEVIRAAHEHYVNVKIICYLRRQDLFLESSWNQNVKQCVFFDDIDKFVESYSAVEYQKKLDEIAEIIGKENVIVRPYEAGQFVGKRGDITSDFLVSCGIEDDWDDVIMPGRINERLEGEYLEIKKVFNEEYAKGTTVSNARAERCFVAHCQSNGKVGYLSEEMRRSILEKRKKENEYIAREYLKREDGILFYDDGTDIPLYQDNLTDREKSIIQMYARVILEYESEIKRQKRKKSYIKLAKDKIRKICKF